jgi:general secretion pathway protein D
MNYTKLPYKVLALLAAPVLISLAVPVTKLAAQSQTETKIKLMAEALRARDAGDLQVAKANLEELLNIAPNDVTVQRLLSGVNNSLATGSSAVTTYAPVADVAPVEQLVEVTYPPRAGAPLAGGVIQPGTQTYAAVPEAQTYVDPVIAAEEARIADLVNAAYGEQKAAQKLAKADDYTGAIAKLDAALATLPDNTLTTERRANIASQRTGYLLSKSQQQLQAGDTKGAEETLAAYIAATDSDKAKAEKLATRIGDAELDPVIQPIDQVNPKFRPAQREIAAQLGKGRSQYAAGDVDGAQETFRFLLTVAPENAEAKYFLRRIADEKARIGELNIQKTRAQMLEEVTKSWDRPQVFLDKRPEDGSPRGQSITLSRKLENIIIPTANFDGMDLGRAVTTLSGLTEENDKSSAEIKGVNMIIGENAGNLPTVKGISVRGMSAKRILDLLTDSVGYSYEVQSDVVVIRRSGNAVGLSADEFPINRAALSRITGIGNTTATTGGGLGGAAAANDPFAAAGAAAAPTAAAGTTSGGGEAEAIKGFLQASGVDFAGVQGSSLAYDGARIIVNQLPRNIERIRNILARYNDVRQVEIEAKFMDVQQGNLEELGVKWGVQQVGGQTTGFAFGSGGTTTGLDINGDVIAAVSRNTTSQTRELNGAFGSSATGGAILINGLAAASTGVPLIPGGVNLGSGAGDVLSLISVVDDFTVSANLRAISQKQGTDLLSAPKVTVLSGNRATITVAQELRYPQSYGDIESEVGSTTSTGGGSAGVTITAGTPEDFTSRNIGVELAVTPTVEEDEYSISLELNPRVTEFEGFVEFGGSSVAITANRDIIIPSGFYSPIFSTREINTKVTVWDGATLVMGGLTREEVKRVDDKVPVLGDIPFIGRAFRSKGESSSKRNLLVFVTANLVSPGGSLKKQQLRGVAPSSVFQNPSVTTPGSADLRQRADAEAK